MLSYSLALMPFVHTRVYIPPISLYIFVQVEAVTDSAWIIYEQETNDVTTDCSLVHEIDT